MEKLSETVVKTRQKAVFHRLTGSAKKVAGKMSDNPQLKAEGAGEKVAGEAREKIGQGEEVSGSYPEVKPAPSSDGTVNDRRRGKQAGFRFEAPVVKTWKLVTRRRNRSL